MRYSTRSRCLLMMMIALVVTSGCSKDDPVIPPPQPATGTIEILQIPEDLDDGGWTLTGPEMKSGAGDQTLERIRPGLYVASWDSVFGFATPLPDTKTLYAHRTITFTGSYQRQTGTIIINQIPDDLPGARWTLTGPVDDSGSGSMTFQDMPIGDYTLAWDDVELHISPASMTQTLGPGGTITFNGKHTYQFGTIVIAKMPANLPGVVWTLTGPQEASGSSSRVLTDMPLGDYTVSWSAVGGYNGGSIPNTMTRTLEAEERITFAGTYFLYIPPGTFMMGSPEDEPGRAANEIMHEVTLTRGFYISEYEATEEWWFQVMGGELTESQKPKNYVSWDLAVEFCNELSRLEGLTPAYVIHGPGGNVTWNPDADGYRLPTEAEWEYACRAGSQTAFANGPISAPEIQCIPDPGLDEMGWYCANNEPPGNDLNYTKVVGRKTPNAWGLYDMHGNVWEWVWCGERIYSSSWQVDPVHNVTPGAVRIFRGGNWNSLARYCRSARRNATHPSYGICTFGVRPVRTAF